MAKNPSTRWYFNDWRLDKELQSCSDAAQGFWAWLLCFCAEEGGYLRIGGKAPTIAELAYLRGRDKRTITRQLAELEKAGVFSRTEDGTIFNRRMVRENGAKVGQKLVKPLHQERGTNKPELHDNPAKPRTRARDGIAQDSRLKKKEEGSDNEKGNPLARCARLGGSFGGRCHLEPGPDAEPYVPLGTVRPRSPPCRKSPALKAQIRNLLVQKHGRFLQARAGPAQIAAYWAAQLGDDPEIAKSVFEKVDAEMRRQGWDDTHEHEVAA
jgi:hypothetical protein